MRCPLARNAVGTELLDDPAADPAVVARALGNVALAALLFRVGGAALGFDPVSRHDGLVSIRRGYTPAELATLVGRAGVRAVVARRPFFRLVASWRPTS